MDQLLTEQTSPVQFVKLVTAYHFCAVIRKNEPTNDQMSLSELQPNKQDQQLIIM